MQAAYTLVDRYIFRDMLLGTNLDVSYQAMLHGG